MNAKRRSIRILAVALIVSVVGGAIFLGTSSAATGQIYFSPGSKTIQKDESFSLSLRINPGTTIDGVKSTLSFDASKLELSSIDTSQSAFTVKLAQSMGTGTATVERGDLSGGVSGDSLVATFVFKALASTGSGTVSVTGNATSAGAYTNPAVSGATVTFTSPPAPAPTPTPTPAPTPTPTPSPTPTTSSTPAPATSTSSSPSTSTTTTSKTPSTTTSNTPSTTPAPATATSAPAPAATTSPAEVSAKETPQYTFTKVAIDCKNTSTVQILYGVEENNLNLQTEPTTNCGEGLAIPSLTGGTKYFYQVVAKDGAGNVTATQVQSFKTKGYQVRVTVLDKNGAPLRKQNVVLHSDPVSATTDGEGVVVFDDVSPGSHTLVYKQGDQEYSQGLEVEDVAVLSEDGSQSAVAQNFSVAYQVEAQSTNYLFIALSVAVVVLVGGVAVARFRGRLFHRKKQASVTGLSAEYIQSAPPSAVQYPAPAQPIGGDSVVIHPDSTYGQDPNHRGPQ